jgi:hypothetical protein
MVKAASREADLIIDLGLGYADFMAEAIERGAQVLSPGAGTGGHHIEEPLTHDDECGSRSHAS